MAVIVLMFRTILAMRSDGTVRIADTVGAVGTVYISLPPAKAAGGQVVVNFKGRQETYAALSTAERPLPSGDKVKGWHELNDKQKEKLAANPDKLQPFIG